MKDTIVIKLGGSTISPSPENIFNESYCKEFSEFVLKNSNNFRFLIVIGGGELAKTYQKLFISNEHKDLAGIIANDTNAKILSLLIEGSVFATPKSFSEKNSENNITIFGGSAPGHTGDFVAAELAKKSGAKHIILLKNVDGVFNSDPKTNSDATIIENINWTEYKNLFGDFEYRPKISVPVDPVAAKFAEENNLKIVVTNSDKFSNLQNILDEKEFVGTIIQ